MMKRINICYQLWFDLLSSFRFYLLNISHWMNQRSGSYKWNDITIDRTGSMVWIATIWCIVLDNLTRLIIGKLQNSCWAPRKCLEFIIYWAFCGVVCRLIIWITVAPWIGQILWSVAANLDHCPEYPVHFRLS